jgi:hypothetical protein
MLRVKVADWPGAIVAEVGEPVATARVKSWPVALRGTVCILPSTPLLLSMRVNVPVSGPTDGGEMLTVIVQAAPAAIPFRQLSLSRKRAPYTGTRGRVVMLAIMSGALPVLLTVTGSDAVEDPMGWPPNARLEGEMLAIGAVAPPAPVKFTA